MIKKIFLPMLFLVEIALLSGIASAQNTSAKELGLVDAQIKDDKSKDGVKSSDTGLSANQLLEKKAYIPIPEAPSEKS